MVDLVQPANRRWCEISKMAALTAKISLRRKWVFFTFLLFLSTPAYSVSYLAIGNAYYSNNEAYHGQLKSLELGHEDNYISPGVAGWLTSLRMAASEDPNSKGYTMSFDQGVGGGTGLGASFGRATGVSQGNDYKGFEQQRVGVRASTWLRQNTLRLGLDVSQQKTNREARNYLDTDGVVVRTAENVKGQSVILRTTHLTTPTTIMMAEAAQTTSDGRPAAISLAGEIRQYVTKLRGAIHGGISYYSDQGDIEPTTDYGRVTANSQTVRYFQRLPKDFIASILLRRHAETEVPRSPDSQAINRAHASEVLSLRWRYVKESWTNDCSEIGIFMGRFRRSEAQGEELLEDGVRAMGFNLRGVM